MNTKTTEFIVSKKELIKGLDQALANYQIAALTQKNGEPIFDFIQDTSDIRFDYQPTVLSPKKFFFPQDEVILEYSNDGTVSTKIEAKPLILFGIRPCDLNGFKLLYEAFADDHGDPNYLAKAEQTVVIGFDCETICDEKAFCFKVGAQNASGGYDIMLYQTSAENYALEIATEKGGDFVNHYLTVTKAQGDEIADFIHRKNSHFTEKSFKNLDKLPELFEQNKKHPIWEQEGARCLSCGSCIMVCPTCYCFDVKDEWQLNLKKGERIRKWDACMLSPFAEVSGGENFRNNAAARLHHRIDRKFNFLMKKHNQAVCVGCGRCVRACLADISPRTIAESIGADQ